MSSNNSDTKIHIESNKDSTNKIKTDLKGPIFLILYFLSNIILTMYNSKTEINVYLN